MNFLFCVQIVQLLTQKNELLGKLTGILEKMGSQSNFVKIAPKPPAVIANPIRARRIVSSNGTTMFVPIAPSVSNKDATPQEDSQKGSTWCIFFFFVFFNLRLEDIDI